MEKNQISSRTYCLMMLPAVIAGILAGGLAGSIFAPDLGPTRESILRTEQKLEDAEARWQETQHETQKELKALSARIRFAQAMASDTSRELEQMSKVKPAFTAQQLAREAVRPPLRTTKQDTQNAETKVQFTYLRQFKPSNIQNGFGADVLLEDDLSERELVSFVKHLAGSHDPVLIRIFTSRIAYDQERNNKYGPKYDSDYILFYVKNFSSAPAYRGFNEIRWMQKTGKFGSKFGAKTKF